MSVIFSFDTRNFIKQKPQYISSNEGEIVLKGNNGCILILIHGLTGTPNEMIFIANYLNKKGYTVICPRLANHGESIWILKHTKWQDLYESVREVILRKGVVDNKGPVFTSGLSMGALLALLLADEFKDRISGVSCLAPTLFYDGWNTPLSKFFLPLGYYTPLRYISYFKEEPPYGIKNEIIQRRIHKYYNNAKLDDMEDVLKYGYPYFPVALLCQLRLLVKHITKKLPNIGVPVQLIQAKDDDMTSIKNSKFIYDRISSEIKEMVLLYDSYHVITADHERDVVAEKMEGFFNRARASRP